MADCIDLILQSIERYADAPAVISGEKIVSYKELGYKIGSIAQFLVENNYKRIVVDMNQGADAYAIIIATLLTGGLYCPLNLQSPAERKQHIATELNADIIFSDSLQKSFLNTDFIEASISELTLIDSFSIDDLKRLYTGKHDGPAYVIFTSGSTGTPKGVVISRKSLNKFLAWSIPTYCVTAGDRWSQFSYLSFDLSVVDIFTTLCAGAVLIPFNNQGQKLRPANTIKQKKISIWHSVPGIIDILIKNEPTQPADLSTVHTMSFCGEPLYERQLAYLFSKNPLLKIFNTYGPTEGTLFCTWVALTIDNYKDYCSTNVSIGSAIPGWNLHLERMEDDLFEVTIYGDYISSGYLNLQSEMFYRGSFNGTEYPAFRTGDLVKISNANTYFSSRKDNQVKVNGNRVELDEIDVWLSKITGKQCISVIHNDRLYSFIETDQIDEEYIKTELSRHLELYKIPSAIFSCPSFPKNINFKIDRNKLKQQIP